MILKSLEPLKEGVQIFELLERHVQVQEVRIGICAASMLISIN